MAYNRRTQEWELLARSYWRTILGDSEPDWYVEQSASKSQLNDGGWFWDYMLDALIIDDLKELLSELPDLVILPLYLYDHSALAISTGSFVGHAVHAEWDSGQVGYIYASREMIAASFGNTSAESVEKAEKLLTGEVESYDRYLRGECYGYRLFKDGEEIDACWGFFGDMDDAGKELASCIPDDCMELIGRLEEKWTYDTAAEYFNGQPALSAV